MTSDPCFDCKTTRHCRAMNAVGVQPPYIYRKGEGWISRYADGTESSMCKGYCKFELEVMMHDELDKR